MDFWSFAGGAGFTAVLWAAISAAIKNALLPDWLDKSKQKRSDDFQQQQEHRKNLREDEPRRARIASSTLELLRFFDRIIAKGGYALDEWEPTQAALFQLIDDDASARALGVHMASMWSAITDSRLSKVVTLREFEERSEAESYALLKRRVAVLSLNFLDILQHLDVPGIREQLVGLEERARVASTETFWLNDSSLELRLELDRASGKRLSDFASCLELQWRHKWLREPESAASPLTRRAPHQVDFSSPDQQRWVSCNFEPDSDNVRLDFRDEPGWRHRGTLIFQEAAIEEFADIIWTFLIEKRVPESFN